MKPFTLIALGAVAAIAYYNVGNKPDIQAAPVETKSKAAFILVNDDSGVLSEPERAKAQRMMLLAQLKALNTRRQFANAQVQIISTSYARPVWVGKVSDLRSERAESLVAKTEGDLQNCNKLAETFTAVKDAVARLEQQQHNEIHVYVFSSLISTPSPCKDVTITLPQVPVLVNFQDTLASSDAVKTIAFYWVNPHQMRLYADALDPVKQWANAGGKTFGMFDMEATAHELRSGLPGVK